MPPIPEVIAIPFLGEVVLKSLSLPALTFIIALLDGFNPCAMWVLLFLIGLLLGMGDKVKMFVLGSLFILTSGLVYFLFLAAWLNVFLFLGFVFWIRVAIGLFAIGAGIYYLREFRNHQTACKVTGNEKRRAVFDRLKSITQNKSFFLAAVGIVLLAIAVNMVELVCSAGLPAIYTQVLALAQIPKWQYYAYLFFYILIFMLDDLLVFTLAMVTFHAVGVNNKYTHYSHLIGGIAMLVIGFLMLFAPELLMFG